MKIFKAEQIRAIDAYTIQKEPVASVDLMERAARACLNYLKEKFKGPEQLIVFCGMGNNGGDGLALARLLNEAGFLCEAVLVKHSGQLSQDASINLKRLKTQFPKCFREVSQVLEVKAVFQTKYDFIIDALLGTGLNKSVEGLLGDTIQLMNQQKQSQIISIDVPSGLLSDNSSLTFQNIVHANLVLSFQFPKLAFLMSENAAFVQEFKILDIQLHAEAILAEPSNRYYISKELIHSLLQIRSKFSNKGDHGHALLMAGSKGKSGAAIISASACMRSGAGLLTLHANKATLQAVLNHLPEAMSSADSETEHISEVNDLGKYAALAFGPGVGLHPDTQRVLKKILHYFSGKLLIDADGLNILSENKTWLTYLPANTILTPHVKEFERLTQKHENDFERLESARQFSIKHTCVLILKSAHTIIAMPDGNVFFNSSGNAGLAKAGSGDGLTGIILGLLSRGYSSPQAALIGVYVHGFAADLCLNNMSMESMLISDVIARLPEAFKRLEEEK